MHVLTSRVSTVVDNLRAHSPVSGEDRRYLVNTRLRIGVWGRHHYRREGFLPCPNLSRGRHRGGHETSNAIAGASDNMQHKL